MYSAEVSNITNIKRKVEKYLNTHNADQVGMISYSYWEMKLGGGFVAQSCLLDLSNTVSIITQPLITKLIQGPSYLFVKLISP